jgi:hypothetical protein
VDLLISKNTKQGDIMAFVATASTSEPRSFSLGPLKCQILTWSAASADTSGTATATSLTTVKHVIIDGLVKTAAPTFAGNVVTLAFADPAATVYGTMIVYGV